MYFFAPATIVPKNQREKKEGKKLYGKIWREETKNAPFHLLVVLPGLKHLWYKINLNFVS